MTGWAGPPPFSLGGQVLAGDKCWWRVVLFRVYVSVLMKRGYICVRQILIKVWKMDFQLGNATSYVATVRRLSTTYLPCFWPPLVHVLPFRNN